MEGHKKKKDHANQAQPPPDGTRPDETGAMENSTDETRAMENRLDETELIRKNSNETELISDHPNEIGSSDDYPDKTESAGDCDDKAKSTGKRRGKCSGIWRGYVSLALRAACLALAGWLFFTQVLLITQAPDNEMFPAIEAGDLIIAYRLQDTWNKDDVVVYTVDGEQKLGRVIGREGDVIMMSDTGTLLVNGTVQAGEILFSTYAKDGITYPYTVPEDSVFVLCDYRTSGTDSRDYGAISLEDVKGKVITILRRRSI